MALSLLKLRHNLTTETSFQSFGPGKKAKGFIFLADSRVSPRPLRAPSPEALTHAHSLLSLTEIFYLHYPNLEKQEKNLYRVFE